MLITFDIADAQWPSVLAGILSVHPRPTNRDDPRYIDGETDEQWARRALQRRFRTELIRCMRQAGRTALAEPNPGLPAL
jgi:hypothetical protein